MRYEFVCKNKKCDYITIIDLPVSERNKKLWCPYCFRELIRQIGTPGLVFKGTGFYTTDYKKPKDLKKSALKEKKAREEGKSGYTEV